MDPREENPFILSNGETTFPITPETKWNFLGLSGNFDTLMNYITKNATTIFGEATKVSMEEK